MKRDPNPTPGASPVDACWNRIGTRGDGSCPQLATYSRCLNCPVFEKAASTLLDRPLDDTDLAAALEVARATNADRTRDAARSETATEATQAQSALVFRIADEWLALPSTTLKQIDNLRPIHSLPHRRNRAVLGLVNVRGALTVAVSLGELLRLDRAAASAPSSRKRYPRMLVAAHRGEPVAFPVDEVEGVLRFAASELLPVPTTLAHSTGSHASGVLAWRDTTIGLLDPDRVFESLAGSLK
ncbi:purine-binding chemotaxis protein CheW [Trinickia terrae]|uniref:Chemotaxis protein CheW n=1 Tax=Trinickia terrae TaxID=2571161 RepID=A0A4U1HZW4_9BURK|nr:chemotaxis protein CheW [Trinickia terrae]TKC85886.1 purine-binding chemotaxis protein CheW [Trinickia terrae]